MVVVFVWFNRNNISSSGTDILPMLLVLYVFIKWSECIETQEADIQSYGLLCIIAVWAVSVKLSVAMCVLLAIYPAMVLVKEKRIKEIVGDIVAGIIIVLPWLIRNVLISGYLVYPYASLDFFDVDWKMPASLVEYDRKEIIVWGRELKDVDLYDLPITEWVRTWYQEQMMRNKVFILLGAAATILIVIFLVIGLLGQIRKKQYISGVYTTLPELLLVVTALVSEMFWLFSAPLLRYGMVYLLIPVAIVGYIVQEIMGEKRMYQCMALAGTLLCCLIMIKDNEDFRWLKPHDYWDAENITLTEWNGVEIYVPVESQTLSDYRHFPALVYRATLEKIELRGESLEDGFRSKDIE